MTDKTAFEKWWNEQCEKAGIRHKETIFKQLANSGWNAAIDAALNSCESVQDNSQYIEMMTPNEVAEKIKAEIQKLRSE